jgi:uncharacterized caspase-like protein/cyclophilin family peptidyl-prolyl cis-trans isomerase
MLRLLVAALVLVATFLGPTSAIAAKRVALVVGNSAYKHAGELPNPRNDAADISALFRSLGFQVVEGIDLDKAAFERKIREFAIALQGAEVGLFFYAGHGLQVGGQNYLVPIDAELSTQEALDFEMIRMDLVHRTMERITQTNLIFLDACRNNPLERNLRRAMGTRSVEIGRGLAAVESGVGTLISFSTQPGNVAADGTGRNSPFAGALVRQLSASNDDLSAVLIAVRNDVMKETQRAQVPWEHSALTGRFYFNPPSQITTPGTSTPARASDAAEAWAAAERVKSLAAFESFIARYSDTFYADLARTRVEEIKKEQAAAADAARKKAEDETRAKAEAERQRVQEASASAARKKTDDDARAKAAAEKEYYAKLQEQADRQRLAIWEERNRAEAEAKKGLSPAKGGTMILELPSGPVKIRLRPDLAPKHVERVKLLASQGFYNGLTFHRVVAGFVAQGGDPLGTGTGGSKLPNLKLEPSGVPFKRGSIGAARTTQPDTANSQFFICLTDTACTALNGQYTLWGEVFEGIEHVDKLALGEPPAKPDRIKALRTID